MRLVLLDYEGLLVHLCNYIVYIIGVFTCKKVV